jgi:hypothetical protein
MGRMPENQILDSRTSAATIHKFDVGTNVIVRNQYIGRLNSGFVVAGIVDEGYILGRLSDRHVLPDVFPFEDVRVEQRRDPLRGARLEPQEQREGHHGLT